jgi:predicted type IV restriction endonuclease
MRTPALALSEIQALINNFKIMSASRRKGMNENATPQGYILPMFRALGWTVDNVNEVSPLFQEYRRQYDRHPCPGIS